MELEKDIEIVEERFGFGRVRAELDVAIVEEL